MYEFPLPLQRDTELERERLQYAVHSQRALYEQLDTQFPNNQTSRMSSIQLWTDAVVNTSNSKRFFFIGGPGGTGQTTIVKKLIDSCH